MAPEADEARGESQFGTRCLLLYSVREILRRFTIRFAVDEPS